MKAENHVYTNATKRKQGQQENQLSSPSTSSDMSLEQKKFLAKVHKKKTQIHFIQLLCVLFFFVVWQVCSTYKIINPFIFSSPARIIMTLFDMIKTGFLFPHVGITLAETLFSFLLVLLISLAGSILLWWNQTFSAVAEPFLVVLNSLPKSALAPLLLVWFGATLKMILITAVSVVVFGSILTIYTGFKETEPDKLMLIRTLQGNKWHMLKLVVIPESIPLLFGVMKSNIGLCLVGVIIAEFMGARKGLGYLIIYSSQVFKLDWLLMSVFLLCLMAMGLYGFLGRLERRILSQERISLVRFSSCGESH